MMSAPILRGWLRERLGFRGVLVSDDMEILALFSQFPTAAATGHGDAGLPMWIFLMCKSLDLQVEAWETSFGWLKRTPSTMI